MSQLLLEYNPIGVPIFVCESKQRFYAENKQYFLAAATPVKLTFNGRKFLEVPCDLERMANVINKYVTVYGYTFNTLELKGARPLLYNKMKRFFLPELIAWDTPAVTRRITKETRPVKNAPSISREQKKSQAAEALAAFLNS